MAAKTKKKPRSAASKLKGPPRKKGMTPFVPTGAQCLQVEMMVGCGLTYKEIACITINPRTNRGISTRTLQRHFPKELEEGQSKIKADVIGSLVRKAKGNGRGAVTAAIFLCKTRYGFRETQHIELESNTGVLVAPATKTPEQWIREQTVLNVTRTKPGEENGNGT